MNDMTDHDALRALFAQAGAAHHAAFAHVDGEDDDWPAWYAAYLAPRLPELTGQVLDEPEIARRLLRLSETTPPGEYWPAYYARMFSETIG
jgi:hypothetical protein